jgi:hypothetical protein
MPNLADFTKDTQVTIKKGTKGVSTWGKEVRIERDVKGKVFGTDKGKVIVDLLSAYADNLVYYTPSDLEMAPLKKRTYHRIKKQVQLEIRE